MDYELYTTVWNNGETPKEAVERIKECEKPSCFKGITRCLECGGTIFFKVCASTSPLDLALECQPDGSDGGRAHFNSYPQDDCRMLVSLAEPIPMSIGSNEPEWN
jgi:hypothetical protein